MSIRLLLLSLAGLFVMHPVAAQTTAQELVFNIQVTTNAATPSITLRWNKQTGVTNYSVLRKSRWSKTFSTLVSYLGQNDTVYVDPTIAIGQSYEYCVQSSSNVNVSGYVYAGIQVPEVHQAGEILLVIDSTYQTVAANELAAYKLDLVKEGWKVSTEYVSRTQSVSSVRSLILNRYVLNPSGLKGVILLGHVPVPYSGKIAPDAHTNHVGAWPCDMYYGDMVSAMAAGLWTDATVTAVTALDTRNHNIVGDGKFDASNKASVDAVKLFVGRIDVYDMPSINSDDVLLFKQYLAKNHSYRAGLKVFRNKGIVDDNFGYFSGEAFAQNGWRNFSSLFGASNVEAGDYINGTSANSYLWSYGCGPGWFTGATGIGTTSDFNSNQMESVFTMLYGSYFGDWDNTDNFLRAPIASPSSALVSIWGGRPNWFLHTMSMGEPIGYSYINSVDNANTYFPKGFYFNKIHQSLQGDPTLKMFLYPGASQVTATLNNQNQVNISWQASAANAVLGYYVYRAANINQEFELLTTSYVTGTSYLDLSLQANVNAVYMVKAVRLENSNTGSFYNLSRGALSTEGIAAVLPVNIIGFTGKTNADGSNTLYWDATHEENLSTYEIERSRDGEFFEPIGYTPVLTGEALLNSYSFVDEQPFTDSWYRLKSTDIDGKSVYSKIIVLHHRLPDAEVSAYPSPFQGSFTVSFPVSVSTSLTLRLVDLGGRVISTRRAVVDEGDHRIPFDGLDDLHTGVYLLLVQNDDNKETRVIKLMKN